ncbi:hypothetical protein [Ammoniphilus resinae]|uniref:DUF2004 domain-containing protein n=1 Tax=Ammoniphilus resinae TaxID=861532 RepID=A0ABS4GMH4_9BACL|nr:hypothetical protein [Ammoniphilus resinae]MBP1931466.1 hypothetical protein [Ammoniphilus resinae]
MLSLAREIVRNYAKEILNLDCDPETLSWESVTLYKEEIDPDLIPIYDLEELIHGDPLTIWMVTIEETEDTEIILALIEEEDKTGFQYIIWLENGVRVWSKVLG